MRIEPVRYLFIILCVISLSSFSIDGFYLARMDRKGADFKDANVTNSLPRQVKKRDYELEKIAGSMRMGRRGRGSGGGGTNAHHPHRKNSSTPLLSKGPLFICTTIMYMWSSQILSMEAKKRLSSMENNMFNEKNTPLTPPPQINGGYFPVALHRQPIPATPLYSQPQSISATPFYDYNGQMPSGMAAGNYVMPHHYCGVHLCHCENFKEKIKQEIYAEIAQKKTVEERRAVTERDLSVPKMMVNPTQSYESMPFQRDPRFVFNGEESSLVPQAAKGRLQLLPPKPEKPIGRIGFMKRDGTQTPCVKEFVAADSSTKTTKKDLRCKLCQVTSTSEQAHEDHIRGKKHKAKLNVKRKEKTMKRKSKNQGTRNLSIVTTN